MRVGGVGAGVVKKPGILCPALVGWVDGEVVELVGAVMPPN